MLRCVVDCSQVREVYPMSGEMVKQKRRDLRRGKLLGCSCLPMIN